MKNTFIRSWLWITSLRNWSNGTDSWWPDPSTVLAPQRLSFSLTSFCKRDEIKSIIGNSPSTYVYSYNTISMNYFYWAKSRPTIDPPSFHWRRCPKKLFRCLKWHLSSRKQHHKQRPTTQLNKIRLLSLLYKFKEVEIPFRRARKKLFRNLLREWVLSYERLFEVWVFSKKMRRRGDTG